MPPLHSTNYAYFWGKIVPDETEKVDSQVLKDFDEAVKKLREKLEKQKYLTVHDLDTVAISVDGLGKEFITGDKEKWKADLKSYKSAIGDTLFYGMNLSSETRTDLINEQLTISYLLHEADCC